MFQGVSYGYGGIEVRAGNATECQNQRNQNGSGGYGIAKQCESDIASSKIVSHDSGADHTSDKKSGSYELGDDAFCDRRRRHHGLSVSGATESGTKSSHELLERG
jgi:hypothetical protein